MKDLRTTRRFRRDVKRIIKRKLDLARLETVIDRLRDGSDLDDAHRDHPLMGEWNNYRESHLAPDWLLIYQTTGDEVLLACTGSHSDLFG